MAPKRINQCQQKVESVVTQLSADWSSTNQTRTQSGTDKFKLETSLEPLPANQQIQGRISSDEVVGRSCRAHLEIALNKALGAE